MMDRSEIVVIGVLSGMLLVFSVHAQEPETRDEAMMQFEQGKEFFNQGQFEKAAIAMKRAYELRPGYKILYYLGWAESENGNYSRALNAYHQYLAEAPPEEEKKISEVKAEIEKLRARVGSISVICKKDGAKVKIDNEVMGIIPLEAPIPLDVGKHEVTVNDGPNELLKEIVRIAGGQEIVLEVEDTEGPPVAAASASTAAPPNTPTSASSTSKLLISVGPSKNKGRNIAFIAFGLAAAAAVGAGVTGALALDQEGEMWDKCDPDGNCFSEDYPGDFNADQDKLRALGITTDVLIGTAAAFAVAGTAVLIVTRRKHREKAARLPALLLTASTLGVALSGRF